MKRYIAAAISAFLMFSATGCSKLEQEHFDKSMNMDEKGTALINAQIDYTLDPDVFFGGVADVAEKLNSQDVDEDIIDSSEISSEMLSDSRWLFDENKKMQISLSASGICDFDNYNSDAYIFAGINGITVKCGKLHLRGDSTYYDKRFAYNMCALTTLSEGGDPSELSEKYLALDKLFGDKQYLRLGYDSDANALLKSSQLGKEYYTGAKALLSGFDTGCVTKIQNGTRFTLTSDNFSSVSKKLASYLKKNNTQTADFINGYLTDSFAASAALSGSETAQLADIAQLFKITPADITQSCDSYNEMLGTPEYKAFMDTFDIEIVNDITEENGIRTDQTTYTVDSDGKNAIAMNAVRTIEKTKKADFEQINTADCVDFDEYIEAIAETYDYDYDSDDEVSDFPDIFNETDEIIG